MPVDGNTGSIVFGVHDGIGNTLNNNVLKTLSISFELHIYVYGISQRSKYILLLVRLEALERNGNHIWTTNANVEDGESTCFRRSSGVTGAGWLVYGYNSGAFERLIVVCLN